MELKVVLDIVQSELDRLGLRARIVGGVVRDTLLNIESNDYDLVVEGDARILAQSVASKLNHLGHSVSIATFDHFLTAKINGLEGELSELDLASARREIYAQPGSLPQVEQSGFEADVMRRDFTINTLSIDLSNFLYWLNSAYGDLDKLREMIIDPVGGLDDLRCLSVRALHDRSFYDDPTRIFRACRYAVRIGGELNYETKNLMSHAIDNGALSTISPARILNELKRIVSEINPEEVFVLLGELGVFEKSGLLRKGDFHQFVKDLAVGLESLTSLGVTDEGRKFDLMLMILLSQLHQADREQVCQSYKLGSKRLKTVSRLMGADFPKGKNEVELAFAKVITK